MDFGKKIVITQWNAEADRAAEVIFRFEIACLASFLLVCMCFEGVHYRFHACLDHANLKTREM